MGGSAWIWLKAALGIGTVPTQLSAAERNCLAKHAAGKRELVEIGVQFGVTTAHFRSVMDPQGTVTGIDPHAPGRLGLSFERLTAQRLLARVKRGRVDLVRKLSFDAAAEFDRPIDFLFIDGDHSWKGVERDWNDWSAKIAPGGIVALHDSRSVPYRQDHDSVRFTQEVVARDARFRSIDSADTLTVLIRV
ncbi:MAG TPA: class I SAM-dependent methyltransferase [Planctomycetia bacterium]|nr:class I SAM-dependent methyltransferase [Planctomycetia bacterium]